MENKIKYSNRSLYHVLCLIGGIFILLISIIGTKMMLNHATSTLENVTWYLAPIVFFFLGILSVRLGLRFEKIRIDKNGIKIRRINSNLNVPFEQIDELLMYTEDLPTNNCWLAVRQKNGKVSPIALMGLKLSKNRVIEILTNLANQHSTKFSYTNTSEDFNNFLQQTFSETTPQIGVETDKANETMLQDGSEPNEVAQNAASTDLQAITGKDGQHRSGYTFFNKETTQENFKIESDNFLSKCLIFSMGLLCLFTALKVIIENKDTSISAFVMIFIAFWFMYKVYKTKNSAKYHLLITAHSLSIDEERYDWSMFKSLVAESKSKDTKETAVYVVTDRLGQKREDSITDTTLGEMAEQFAFFNKRIPPIDFKYSFKEKK